MEEKKLTVNFNGKNVEIDVFEIIDNLVEGKTYIVYCIDGYDEEFLVSILEENETSYTLKEISDDKELKMVEDYLEKIVEKEEG